MRLVLKFVLLFSRMIAGCNKSMVEFDVSVQVLKMVIQLRSECFHTRSKNKKINETVSDSDDSFAK